MDYLVWMYLTYLAISIGLTVWVAGTLSRNGLVFLEEVFDDKRLAAAVNRLLVVGFYLVNLGYVTVAMRYGSEVDSLAGVMEQLSLKVGLVLLVLGALHFLNVLALNRYRRGRLRRDAMAQRPPLPPAAWLPMPPPPQPTQQPRPMPPPQPQAPRP
jgi:hypothetical protein